MQPIYTSLNIGEIITDTRLASIMGAAMHDGFPISETVGTDILNALLDKEAELVAQLVADATAKIKARVDSADFAKDLVVEIDRWLHSKGIILVAPEKEKQ